MPITSNDEDLELFMGEFAKLLNKYHYAIDPFRLRKITGNFAIVGFTGDGGPEIVPNYFELTEENKKWAVESGVVEDENK